MTAILPNLDHITLKDESKVYIPAEDTFLLCDAILQEKEFLINRVQPKILLEMGVGSGCVLTYLTHLLLTNEYHSFFSFGIDINIEALKLTKKTFEINIDSTYRNRLELIQSSLFTAMESDRLKLFQRNIDILIFNPPYVPSDSSEIGSYGIEASYAGGIDGREVIDKFLPKIPLFLSERGVCYLVLVRENRPKEIQQILLKQFQLNSQIITKRQAVNEELSILKIFR